MIHQKLRQATREQHHSLERQLNPLRPGYSAQDYRDLLERMYGLYRPLEAQFAAAGAHLSPDLDLERRRKLGLLAQDLEALGRTANDLAALPQCTEPPLMHSLPAALGSLYVLEGSTLGGQVICRQLPRRLGVNAQRGAKFFSGYGVETLRMWGEFLDVLERRGAAHEEAVVASACDSFSRFSQWFTP